MKCQLKLFSVCLLLLFCLSWVCWPEDQLLDPSEMTTAEILQELSENLTAREAATTQREQILNQREAELEEREKRLKKRIDAITGIESYWMSLIKDIEKIKTAEYWRGFLHGSAIGVFVGATAGIALGIKLQIPVD